MFLNGQSQKVWFEVSDSRLSRLVLEVWESLPVDVTATASERINKITDNEPRVTKEAVDGTMAFSIAMPWGSEIYFYPQDYSGLSDGDLKFLTAHEIAHGIFHNEHFCDVPKSWAEQERQADQMAKDWGFGDPYSMNDE